MKKKVAIIGAGVSGGASGKFRNDVQRAQERGQMIQNKRKPL